MFTYTYVKDAEPSQLLDEIRSSDILIAADRIDSDEEGNIYVVFKAELSALDKTTLDGIVEAHVPKPPAKPLAEVITQFEKNDKDLKMCSATAPVDTGTGAVTLQILCPPSGRWIDGGAAFFTDDEPHRVIGIEGITPVDLPENAMFPGSPALSAGDTLKAYHDDEVTTENQGWRVPSKADNGPIGEIEVTTMAGYGFFPGNMILQIRLQKKGVAPFSGWGTVNIKWGKKG